MDDICLYSRNHFSNYVLYNSVLPKQLRELAQDEVGREFHL
jgi:hypothetical protein